MAEQAESWRARVYNMIVGITGGIGCGKSTAAALLEREGLRRLDSDELVRTKVLTSPSIIAALRERFGDTVLTPDGQVDRAQLAQKVFPAEAELRWLEDLTHPVVFELWRSSFRSDPAANWVVEVPLLFEKGLEIWFDFTVCVASAPAQQLARLEQRGLPRALAEQRISKQLPLAQKIVRADFVLWNDGSIEFLQEQVSRLVVSLPAAR